MKNDPTRRAEPSESWQQRPAPVRRRPAPPRRGGAHAARLRRSTPGSSPCGARAAVSTRRRDAARAAPLRRRCSPSAAPRPRTAARKLAALRQLYRVLHEHGEVPREPRRPRPGARSAREAARASWRRRDLRAARPHPRDDAAGAPRPRAVRARLRVRPARGGARRPRRRERRLRRRGGPRRGQGPQDAASCPAGEQALRAVARWLERGAPGAAERRRRAGAVPLQVRPAAVDLRRPAAPAVVGAAGRDPGRHLTARPAPLVRHAPAGRRRRPARDPGAARPQLRQHDADLHSGRVCAPEVRLRASHPRA